MGGMGTVGRRASGVAAAVAACTMLGAFVFATGAPGQGGGLKCLGENVDIGNGFDETNLIGTEGRDVIHVTNRDDFIDGRGGNDLICTFAGRNTVIGGEGDDRIEGGPDGEILVGDEYSTTGPASGSGNDEIKGGAGNDINVGDAYSTVAGAEGSGNDRIGEGDGDDILVGDAFSPVSAIGSGNDVITGGEGNDEEVGDALVGSWKEDAVSGASGAGSGNDEINGFPDTDFVVGDVAVHGDGLADCSNAGSDKLNGEINANSGPAVSPFGNKVELLVGDCYSSNGDALGATGDSPIINGGDGEDVLVGDSYAPNGAATGTGSENNMLGGGGNDTIFSDHHPGSASTSGGGDDHPRGGKGNDRLEGGPADDLCSGGPGKDKFTKNGDNACEDTTGDP